MTHSITDSFSLIITLFKHVGLYHDSNQSKFFKIWTYSSYFLTVLCIISVFINLVVEKNLDLMQINQMFVFLAEGTAGCLKILPFFVKGRRIKECIEFFGGDCFVPKHHEEKRITEDCFRVCKRNVKFYTVIVTFTATWWSVLPFFESKLRLPLSLWLPYNVRSGPVTFYATYLYTVMG